MERESGGDFVGDVVEVNAFGFHQFEFLGIEDDGHSVSLEEKTRKESKKFEQHSTYFSKSCQYLRPVSLDEQRLIGDVLRHAIDDV